VNNFMKCLVCLPVQVKVSHFLHVSFFVYCLIILMFIVYKIMMLMYPLLYSILCILHILFCLFVSIHRI
jgi:hypothetical protein